MMGCPAQARLGAGSPLLPSSAAQTRLLQSPLLGRSLGASRAWPRLAGPSTTPVCSAAVQIREIRPAASNNGVKVSHKEMSAPAAGYLANNSTSYKEEHKIRAYEVGPDQKTSIVTIANLLQEVSGNHAVALWGRTEEGFATDPIMVAMNLIFAATRIQIQMLKYPKWGDLVQIETYFSAEGRVGARRDWVIRSAASGEILGRATSTWVMVNLKTRRVAKIPDEMRTKLEVYAPDPERHAVPPEQAKHKLLAFELPAEIVGPTQVARRSDVDMNGHINNVTYLAWTLETVPRDVFHMNELCEVEIDYKAECHSGDTVEALGRHIEENTNGTGVRRFLHLLRRCDDQGCRELVRARTSWRPVRE